ncbi:hypothetical protein BDW60DRAFT_206883 [Aspergillus nidulans var. acristatus]|jgi:hypothetical protein
MTRLPTIIAALYALYCLPLISAWTFVWRNASDIPTVEEGTGGQTCKEINHAKGNYLEFDPEDDTVRIYMYAISNCSEKADESSEKKLAQNSTGPIRGFAVISLSGAETSTSGELTPFPGEDWFKSEPNSPIITAMGKRLVAEGCGKYKEGPGPQWSDADRQSYQCWQEKLGYSNSDADGWPGKTSWDQLKVPLADESGPDSSSTSSSTTQTPTSTSPSTSTATNTPVPDTGASSESSLSGGAIAGIAVGSVIGVGLIGAILYLARRVRKPSAPASAEEEQELKREPEAGGGIEHNNHGDAGAGAGAAAAVAGDSKGAFMENKLHKPPVETEAVPAKIFELAGDTGTVEMRQSRGIHEMSDSQRITELSAK